MKGNYAPDTFTEIDVLRELDMAGLKHKVGHRYILSQCPTHDDENPSVQIYKDDWFVNCHSGCGRYHVTKAFPGLRPASSQGGGYTTNRPVQKKRAQPVTERTYQQFNEYEYWQSLPEIPNDHQFKNLPIDNLTEMGWRWVAEKNSYYIPYFDMSQKVIPFSQLRHLSGDRRFTFLKDAKPLVYGMWNLDPSNSPIFVVEGASDAAVLNHVGVPWVALPSASSAGLMRSMAEYCKKQGIELVYAGDNDEAGDKLREALEEVMSYRIKQPPKKYKDWGDFYAAEGFIPVYNYCATEHGWDPIEDTDNSEKIKLPDDKSDVEKVLEVFPGAVQLEILGGGPEEKHKEQSKGPLPTF